MNRSASSSIMTPPDTEHYRIAFGSCNNQNLTNPLWDVLTQRQPKAFVWAGDAIYADLHLGNDWSAFPPTPIMSAADPQRLRHFYDIQRGNSSYRHFLKETNATVFGTIDDHDFGMNNGDKTYEFPAESGLEFLRFTGENTSSPVYQRAKKGYGVYGVKVFDFDDEHEKNGFLIPDAEAAIDPDVSGYRYNDGEEEDDGTTDNLDDYNAKDYKDRRVAVFFLDVRTNRTPWRKGFQAWSPNYSGDFLGERQWRWFEAALRKSDASVNVIVNGLQVHSYRHPNSNMVEVWSQFPASRQRLYDAILQDGVKAPILVSGDVHMAQLMRKDCWSDYNGNDNDTTTNEKDDGQKPAARPLIEFTTSGMTHSWGTCYASSQKFHTRWWMYYPMHTMSVTLMTVAQWLLPMPDLLVSPEPDHVLVDDNLALFENGGAEGSNQGQQLALDQNFGEMEFDFINRKVWVRAFGKEASAPPLLSASYSFDQLSGTQPMRGAIEDITSFAHSGGMIMDGKIVANGQNVCVNHRGPPNTLQIAFAFIVWHCVLVTFILGPQIFLARLIFKLVRQRL